MKKKPKKKRIPNGKRRESENDEQMEDIAQDSMEILEESTELEDSSREYKTYSSKDDDPFVSTAIELLGVGNQRDVEEVRKKYGRNETVMARIIINWGTVIDMEKQVLKEVRAMKRCSDHRHVVHYVVFYLLEVEGEDAAFNIVMQPRANCNLENFLLNQGGEHGVDGVQRAMVLQEAPGCLNQALQFIHKKGVYHADLCCQSILVMQQIS